MMTAETSLLVMSMLILLFQCNRISRQINFTQYPTVLHYLILGPVTGCYYSSEEYLSSGSLTLITNSTYTLPPTHSA